MKDLFSKQSAAYAKFRPTYPAAMFDYLLSLVKETKCAWDCGTGNGQVAAVLADHFDEVYATDISQQQLDNATQKHNITYSRQNAEQTNFASHQFDLITIAQAIHWFHFDTFYKEVRRTLKPQGIIAVIGYGLMHTEGGLNDVIQHFYHNITGPYWDKERRYLDENYETIPFPFKENKTPSFTMDYEWNLEQLIGYFSTWSAVQHYIKQHSNNPVELVKEDLKAKWGDRLERTFSFNILLRIGSVE